MASCPGFTAPNANTGDVVEIIFKAGRVPKMGPGWWKADGSASTKNAALEGFEWPNDSRERLMRREEGRCIELSVGVEYAVRRQTRKVR